MKAKKAVTKRIVEKFEPIMYPAELTETLSWAAYHLYDGKFYTKWKNQKMTKDEFKKFLSIVLEHKKQRIISRSFWQFKLIRQDKLEINLISHQLSL